MCSEVGQLSAQIDLEDIHNEPFLLTVGAFLQYNTTAHCCDNGPSDGERMENGIIPSFSRIKQAFTVYN
jgi:hypothetical protein